jgi:hypothetical protein
MCIRKGLIFQCIGVIALVFACIRCSDRQAVTAPVAAPATTAPTTAPSPKLLVVLPVPPHTFNGAGIQFDYPGNWQIIKPSSSLFALVAPGPGIQAVDRPEMTLDVPNLPWHIPGMISAGMVASGYVDDLRKNHIPDAVVKEQKSLKIAGENGRMLTCVGHRNGRTLTDIAVVMVHADRVYIFSTDCDQHGCDLAGKTLLAAMASVKWTR